MDRHSDVDQLSGLPDAIARQLGTGVRTGLVVIDSNVVLYANPMAAAMYGRTDGSLVGLPVAATVAPAWRAEVFKQTRRRLAGHAGHAYDVRGLRGDGSEFDLRVWGQSLEHQGRTLDLVTLTDVTELKEAVRRAEWQADMLARSEALCRSGSFAMRWPSSAVVLSAGLRALVGCTEDPAQTTQLDQQHWIPQDERARVSGYWQRARVGEPFEFQHDVLCADGQRLVVLHRGVLSPPAAQGLPILGVAILSDITAQRNAEQRVLELANFDEITGLPNRANLLQQLHSALQAATGAEIGAQIGAQNGAQRGEPIRVSLMSIEVPRINELASTMGFGAGDALAMAMAARLSSLAVAGERVAHLGGSEFSLLIEHAPAHTAANTLARARALAGALQQAVVVGGTDIYPLCRIGLSSYPTDGNDGHLLLTAAQTARLGALSSDGIALHQPECNARALRALQLEAALRHALPRNELRLVYQPQVCLATGNVIGAEALLRWQSADWGAVKPEEFIPVAERSGLIAPIGDWVIRQACEQIMHWQRAGLAPIRVSVNISPVQFQLGDVALSIRQALKDTGASPAALGVELTESALMHDGDRVAATLRALRASGIEISLDDFGTGFSSLSRLRTLPIDLLKIDRSFVSDVTAAPESASMTRSIINLAHGLQIPVIAEGVETEGQLNMLAANGCDRIQGFLFSPPISADEMAALLRSGRRLDSHLAAREVRSRTLLLVDDELSVLSALRRLFRRDGYRLLTAASGAEALELLAVNEVDVILSDQRMPGMTGVDFLRRTKALYPHTIRMTLSGFTDLQSIIDAVNEGAVYKFLTKPWDDERLREHVAHAFKQKEMADDNRRLQCEVAAANADMAVLNQRLEQLLGRQSEQSERIQAGAGSVRDLVDLLPAAVFALDPDGMLAFLNQSAAALMPGALACLGGDPGPQLAHLLATVRAGAPDPQGHCLTVTINQQACHAWLKPMPAASVDRGEVLILLPVTAVEAVPITARDTCHD